MRAVVVYESLWGNTANVARAIGDGIGPDAIVVSTAEAGPDVLEGADLVVAGAPVFVFHLSSDRTRRDIEQNLEPGAPTPNLGHPSLRSWLGSLAPSTAACAAFDTQVRGPFGRGAPKIASALKATGMRLIARPDGFIVVDKYGPLADGELERATRWGATLARHVRDGSVADDSSDW